MSILVISPHRDDESIACGGFLLDAKSKGQDTYILHICSGSGATKEEATQATDILGAKDVYDLNFPDVLIVSSEELVKQIVAIMRRVQPRIVLSPWSNDDDPTHKTVYEATKEAIWLSTFSIWEDELGQPSENEISIHLGFEVWSPITNPDLLIDISGFEGEKRRAISCYATQTAMVNFEEAALGLNAYRAGMHAKGAFAEAFTIEKISSSGLNLYDKE